MKIDSRLLYLIYYTILIWKFNHRFNTLNTVLLTLSFSLMLQIFNGASYIARYKTVLKYKRLLFETGSLLVDEKYGVNYGLQLIIFFRFVDMFLFLIKIYPLVIPIIQNIFRKVPDIPKRKPIYDD